MNFNEIIEPFEKVGIAPIKVLRSPEFSEDNDIILEENIPPFLNCLKAFNVPAFFISVVKFDETEFIHETDIDGEYEDIDLTKHEQKLISYKKYIGEPCYFELFAPIGTKMIRTMIPVDWYKTFYDLKEKVLQQIEKTEEKGIEELELQKSMEVLKQKELADTLLKKLRALSKNKDFCDFASKTKQTQIAIKAYAEELIPELEALGEKILKSEISELTGKIRARKSIKNITS